MNKKALSKFSKNVRGPMNKMKFKKVLKSSDIPYYVFGNLCKLKEARAKYSLTLGRVSEALAVTTDTFCKYENGEIWPDKKIYNRMARLFDWEIWKDEGEDN